MVRDKQRSAAEFMGQSTRKDPVFVRGRRRGLKFATLK
jgi:hypothetical protein